MTLVSPW